MDMVSTKNRTEEPQLLKARAMGIDTYQEPVIYMRSDCYVCRSEGFESQSRIKITGPSGQTIIATLNTVRGDYLSPGESGLSDIAWKLLAIDGTSAEIKLSHPEPVDSFSHVRSKLFGHELTESEFQTIINDITNRKYSDVQLSAFLTACMGESMTLEEVVKMTRAMVNVGQNIKWGNDNIFDKHCVGGLPGNRTTPIIVAIVSACGVVIPKTSSRAITSPAGTADTMEMLAPVELSLDAMQKVVEQEGGCITWGGSVSLSPADDLLIRIERALNIDSEAQLVASVISKKAAAGSTHVLIDIPVGPTAKLRDRKSALRIANMLSYVGGRLGLRIDNEITDGTQPIGYGIGPALEANDVLAVLQNDPNAPDNLIRRSVKLAGKILTWSKKANKVDGERLAYEVLSSGRAWEKFQAICEAQGGMRIPPKASQNREVVASRGGRISAINNRRIAKIAKLAGAPSSPAAGVKMHVQKSELVVSGQPLFTLYAETIGEFEYALNYIEHQNEVIQIDDISVMEKVTPINDI